MRLNDPGFLDRLFYGERLERRPPPRRWVRSDPGRRGLRDRCARLTVGAVLRHGGAFARPIFDAEGQRLAEQPLWNPAVAAVSDWRLSSTVPRLLVELIERDPATDEAPLPLEPVTAADLIFCDRLAERLEATGEGVRWLPELRRRNPYATLWQFDRLGQWDDRLLDGLEPWLDAGWLVPYQLDALARRWLAIDSRRRLLGRREQLELNRRLTGVIGRVYRRWAEQERYEHLVLFVRFYAGWLRGHGGLRGVLHLVRAGDWGRTPVAEKEAYEASHGRLLAPALALRDLAGELRRYGWERTQAEEYFLGRYSRELEPVIDELRHLHDELLRII